MIMKIRYELPKKSKRKLSKKYYHRLSKKEIVLILLFSIIASFISFIPIIPSEPIKIITTLFIFLIIITSSFYAKKIIGKKHALKIEHSIWELKTFWFAKESSYKKPIPLGIIFPFFLAIFSLGTIKPFSFFQFDYEEITSRRLVKDRGWKRGLRKEFAHETDVANTASAGIWILLIIAIIGYILSLFGISLGEQLALYSLYYGLWNLLPISNLDGAKILFVPNGIWAVLTLLYLIGLIILFI